MGGIPTRLGAPLMPDDEFLNRRQKLSGDGNQRFLADLWRCLDFMSQFLIGQLFVVLDNCTNPSLIPSRWKYLFDPLRSLVAHRIVGLPGFFHECRLRWRRR